MGVPRYILGIETSCDETSAAVVDTCGQVLSNVIFSQIREHQPYGGVVPEIASRSHVENLPAIIEKAVADAGLSWDKIDAVASTRGPGLVSSLLIGTTAAKALALQLDKPFIGVNHLEAHLYSVFIDKDIKDPDTVCPLVILLVSGGHTCLIEMNGVGDYTLLGQTIDDAAGEALDKGAILMNLGYPGGPVIDKMAKNGNPNAITFPRGLEQSSSEYMPGGLERAYCFSYSGLKTALLYHIKKHPETLESPERVADVAASYQCAVVDALISRVERALKYKGYNTLGCAGGVARNSLLRARLGDLASQRNVRLILAEPGYCTDNAAMVAFLAMARCLKQGIQPDAITVDVHPNLSLV